MASDKMDMSLEDIIKMNRQSNPNNRRGGGGRGRSNAAGSGGGAKFGRRDDRGSGNRRENLGVRRGGVPNRRDNRSTFSRPAELPDQWQHDMFDDDRPSAPVRRSFPSTMSNRQSGLLQISNLDFGVNDTDMKELFGEFGPLKRAVVHYDRSGRSLGNAEIEFENRLDAVKAKKQYNNVPLDGKPMKITLAGEEDDRRGDGPNRSLEGRIGARRSSSSGTRPNNDQGGFRGRRNDQRGFKGGRGRSGGGGGGGGGSRRGSGGRGGGNRRDAPTKEELDAELDAYNSKMEV